MKRRITSVIVLFCVIASSILPAFAVEYVEAQKEASEQYIVDTFGYYYELYNGDGKKATEALLASKDSLQLIAEGELPENEVSVASAFSFGENPADVTLSDSSLVYDSDWDTYVYNATWGWTQVDSMEEVNPLSRSLQPIDIIGVYSQDATRMSIKEVIMYGYSSPNDNGTSDTVAFYSSEKKASECYGFGIVVNEANVMAFSLDDREVYRGRISVPLYYNSSAGTTGTKIMLQYSHSWTNEELTGIGFTVGAGSAGFSVNWATTVEDWGSYAYSTGLKLP